MSVVAVGFRFYNHINHLLSGVEIAMCPAISKITRQQTLASILVLNLPKPSTVSAASGSAAKFFADEG